MKPETSEQLIQTVIDLKEKGKSNQEIFGILPHKREEVRQTLQILKTLSSQRAAILPQKTLLQTLLSHMSAPAPKIQQKHFFFSRFSPLLKSLQNVFRRQTKK